MEVVAYLVVVVCSSLGHQSPSVRTLLNSSFQSPAPFLEQRAYREEYSASWKLRFARMAGDWFGETILGTFLPLSLKRLIIKGLRIKNHIFRGNNVVFLHIFRGNVGKSLSFKHF